MPKEPAPTHAALAALTDRLTREVLTAEALTAETAEQALAAHNQAATAALGLCTVPRLPPGSHLCAVAAHILTLTRAYTRQLLDSSTATQADLQAAFRPLAHAGCALAKLADALEMVEREG